MQQLSRRTVLAAGSLAVPLASAGGAQLATQGEDARQVALPPFKAETERQDGPPPAPLVPEDRPGFALVGLGNLSVRQLLPAFAVCKRARCTALVSGNLDKAKLLAREYGIPSVYGYGDYAKLARDTRVEAVYIVLPNGLHREHAISAFESGKHVLSEKPMANSARECKEMIAAGKRAGRLLMIAYRIQYEPNNRLVRDMLRQNRYGPVKLIEMANVQRQGAPEQWRHKLALAGGGSLPDIGLYCLNTSRFHLGEEPVEVFATEQTDRSDRRFREVEENLAVQMRFPSGALVSFICGYDAHESRRYRVQCTTGWIGMDPAFSYSGLRMEEAHAEGDIEQRAHPAVEPKNQFALEIDHFAACLRQGRQPFTPGEEGLQDHRIMERIYESARSRRPVSLPPIEKRDAFRGPEPVQS